ncbi:hypothetical protein FRC11_002931 [Ceratobasidium sp. 423]|nr:hypothetical protein FRC11_002931 [Ceratobasidium sp. 423]
MDEFLISLPSLQYPYLEDLNLDVLQYILGSIAPGPHIATLNWTDRCYGIAAEDGYDTYAISDLHLNISRIDVLMLRRESGVSFSADRIHALLQAMPTITSLYLDSVYLDSKVLHALVPPARSKERVNPDSTGRTSAEQNRDDHDFPELKKLHISRSHCHELSALRDLSLVAANHPLDELGIGIGSDCDCDKDELRFSLGIPEHENLPRQRTDQVDVDLEMEQVWSSLASSVPRLVRLSGNPSDMPPAIEFESRVWQL